MNYQEINDFIKKINVYKSKREIFLKNHYPQVLNEIYEKTKFLDDTNCKNMKITFAERMYCIENDIHDRPKCIECGNYVYFRTDYNKYREFCSTKCSKSSNQTRIKRENTNKLRHGDEHWRNDEKIRETRYKKYGGKWSPNDFMDKVRKTNFERHGDENWNNKEKSIATNMIKYGVKHPFMLSEIQQKSRNTFAENHNGISCVFKTPGFQELSKEAIKRKSYQFILNSSIVAPNFTEYQYVKHDKTEELEFTCKKCGTVFKSIWDNGMCDRCPSCFPKEYGTSNEEKEVFEYVKSIVPYGWSVLNKDIENRNTISPKEIDIIVRNEKDEIVFGLEFDGLFYHSEENGKNRKYHVSKTDLCEERGFGLVHLFENEWISKQHIVKSRLCNMVGRFEHTVYARKCSIKSVSDYEKDVFLESNHIQGKCSSSVNIGLFNDNELIALMTFGKSRFNKKYEWELLRFCNKVGYHIPGSAGRLLKHFERNYNPTSLVSYADRRWSRGNLYTQLGFIKDHVSDPNYWYFKPRNPNKIYNRVGFQKFKLKGILETFDESVSELKNMENNGYMRIWDCGNMVFVKNYDK